MPSNIISINFKPEYNMPDSKMQKLMKFLKENAYPIDKDTRDKLASKYSPLVSYRY
jgi:hypothetical protein